MKSKKLMFLAPTLLGTMIVTGCNKMVTTSTNKVSEAQWQTAITDLFNDTVDKNYHVSRNKDNSDKVDTLDVKGNLLTVVNYFDTSTMKTFEIKNKFGYFTNTIEVNSEGEEIANWTDYPEVIYADVTKNRSQTYNFMAPVAYLFGDYSNFKYDDASASYKRKTKVEYYPHIDEIQFVDGKIKTVYSKTKEEEKEVLTTYTFEYGNAVVEKCEVNNIEIKYDNISGKFRTNYFEHDKTKTYFFSIDFAGCSSSIFNSIKFDFKYENGTSVPNMIRSDDYSPRGWLNTIIFDSQKQIGLDFVDAEGSTTAKEVTNDAFLSLYKKTATFCMWANSGSSHEITDKVCFVIETSHK